MRSLKSINTLIEDIHEFLRNPPEELPEKDTEALGQRIARMISEKLSKKGRQEFRLRISNLGEHCDRKTWYSQYMPEAAEPLSADARMKFLFGDILEALLMFLAKAAGHTVEHEQETVEIDGVVGHVDGTIDGELVDCKSASTMGFSKFREHTLDLHDDFGYLVQLGGYGSKLGTGRDHFLAVDKQFGHIVLDSWEKSELNFEQLVKNKRKVLSSKTPPERGYGHEKFQESGNRKLSVPCSYCPFKRECWPGLRTFLYSGKPVFLAVVKREPSATVKEVK